MGEARPSLWEPTPAPRVDLCDWIYDEGAAPALAACCTPADATRASAAAVALAARKTFCARTLAFGIADQRLTPGSAPARSACRAALAATKSLGCGTYRAEDVDAQAWASAAAACRDAYVGAVPQGQPCGHPDECQPGLACRGYTVEEGTGKMLHLGICRPPAAIGEACGAGTYLVGPTPHRTVIATRFGDRPACAAGAFCDAEGTCRARAAIGASCASDDACVEGAGCLGGTCAAGHSGASPDGAACVTSRDCGPMSRCSAGACVPRLTAGAACVGESDCEGACLPTALAASRCAASCGSR